MSISEHYVHLVTSARQPTNQPIIIMNQIIAIPFALALLITPAYIENHLVPWIMALIENI